MQALINEWVVKIDQKLRRSAGSRMPSEWAKKAECWEAVCEIALDLPEPLPPEMQAQLAGGTARGTRPATRNDGLSREDLELIEKCRQIDATTWFKVAQWGTKSKAIHWRVAGIAKDTRSAAGNEALRQNRPSGRWKPTRRRRVRACCRLIPIRRRFPRPSCRRILPLCSALSQLSGDAATL